jgi:hypothetical protein
MSTQTTIPPATAAATVNAENPWPGLLSFREGDAGYFHGRRAETEDLLRLVLRERLVVLFGLSGLGKSSLLQAGLFPKLRPENIFPIYLRLDFSADRPDFAAQVFTLTRREAAAREIEAPAPQPAETMWEYFHREGNAFWNARNRPVLPLLVFDQFEELFTLGHLGADRTAITESFLDQLADLAEGRPPARLKAWVDEHPDKASTFDFGRHYYKLLLSIREDFVPDLETLRTRMPMVALNRLRLGRMNGEAALRVVNQAAQLIDADVAEQVVRFVAAGKDHPPLSELEIEPALLSVVCRELNNRRQALNEPRISAHLLQGNQEQVLADFYERSMADLAPEVRSFIEEHLLTVSGYRDSVAMENALSTPGVSRESIDALVERRLIRREDRGGVQRLELTHDLLAGVVRASRDNRRQREEAERERTALLKAQEEEKQRLLKAQEEERLKLERTQELEKRKRMRVVSGVFASLACIAIATAIWALISRSQLQIKTEYARKQTEEADKQRREAEQQRQLAVEQTSRAEEENKKYKAAVDLINNTNKQAVQAAVDSQSSAAALLPRVYVQIVNQDDRDYAKQIAARLTTAGVLVLGIQYVPDAAPNQKKSDVRYYRKADEPEAQTILEVLKAAGAAPVQQPIYLKGFEGSTKVRPNHYEVWLANGIARSQAQP